MKLIPLASIVCATLFLGIARTDAATVTFGFTGTISEVSELTSPPMVLKNSGIGPGGKIVGTVSWDDEAPITSGGGGLIADYGEPGINMTTTFYVLGSGVNFNSGPVIDTLRLVTNDFVENGDSFHIFRNIDGGGGLPSGLFGTGGQPILTRELKISLSGLPTITQHTGVLSQFNVNYPTLPPGSSSSFEIRGDDGVVSGGYTVRGTINSFVPIPEPSTIALAGIGVLAFVARGLRRRSTL